MVYRAERAKIDEYRSTGRSPDDLYLVSLADPRPGGRATV